MFLVQKVTSTTLAQMVHFVHHSSYFPSTTQKFLGRTIQKYFDVFPYIWSVAMSRPKCDKNLYEIAPPPTTTTTQSRQLAITVQMVE